MLARFFAASGISKRYFGLDLAPIVPGLSRAESKAYEFLHAQRAHPRVRAQDHQNPGLRTLLREPLTMLYLRGPLTACRKASAYLR
jgi:hypothetical protein